MFRQCWGFACSPPRLSVRGSAQGNKPEPVPMKLKVGDVAPDFKLKYFDGIDLKDVS